MKKPKDRENNQFYIEYGIDLDGRRIVIDEEIDEYSIGWAIRAIHKMIEINHEPIDIYLNSYGGSVYDGLALYDLIRRIPVIVRTHATGKIMSMAFILYLAGDERYSELYATFMAHGLSSAAWGKVFEMEIELKECKRLENILLDILAERTFKSKRWWSKFIKKDDKYIDIVKAFELGIVTDTYIRGKDNE